MGNWFNSNTFHNVANVLIVLLSAGEAGLLATGCTTLVNGQIECAHSWINPSIAPMLVLLLGVVKVAVNITRDGIGGLVKTQPPVTDKTAQVTVAAKEDATITVAQTKPAVKTNVSQKAR